MMRPIIDANHLHIRSNALKFIHTIMSYLPIWCPNGPKILVPTRYEMEAGRKAAPCSQFDDFIVSIINRGKEGSRMAMPRLAKVMAPAATII